MAVLNDGIGTAPTAFYVDLMLPSAAAAAGGAILFFRAVLASVHHANRRSAPDDYLAVAFPEFDSEKPGLRRFGERVRVFGSERRLDDLLDLERIGQCLRTGLLARIPRIRAADGFARAVAFVRVRSGDRRTVGDMVRRLERSHERGRVSHVIETRLAQLAEDTSAGTRMRAELDRERRRLEDGCARLLLDSGVSLVIHPKWVDGGSLTTAQVSTYGLSSAARPSPVPAE